MINLVKNVFLTIMGVTVAMILYMVFFGTTSFDGTSLVGTKTGNITQTSSWQGVLWYAAESIETPISRYYYEYCYLPNIHQSDYVDEALGGIKNSAYYNGNIQQTRTDLSYDASNPCADFYNFGVSLTGIPYYSTGWY